MKTIRVYEIELSKCDKIDDLKNYPTAGFYLVTKKGFSSIMVFVNNEVMGLPVQMLNFIEKITEKQPITERRLSESFVLELVNILSKKP
jgi:hypothetical protein